MVSALKMIESENTRNYSADKLRDGCHSRRSTEGKTGHNIGAILQGTLPQAESSRLKGPPALHNADLAMLKSFSLPNPARPLLSVIGVVCVCY